MVNQRGGLTLVRMQGCPSSGSADRFLTARRFSSSCFYWLDDKIWSSRIVIFHLAALIIHTVVQKVTCLPEQQSIVCDTYCIRRRFLDHARWDNFSDVEAGGRRSEYSEHVLAFG